MASRLCLLFASLLASLCFSTCYGDTAVFLDSTSEPYLNPSLPETLSAEGYATLQSVLANQQPAFEVSKALSDEVASFLTTNVFHRPIALWNVVLFGVTAKELFENEGQQTAGAKRVDLSGVALTTNRLSSTKRVLRNCGSSCLSQSFAEGADRLGGSYTEAETPLHGSLTFNQCPAGSIQLRQGALSLWAAELGSLWKDLSTSVPTSGTPMHFDSMLIGLYMVRQQYGASSEEFQFATCYTRATLLELHRTLGQYFNGQALTTILMQSSVEVIEKNQIVEAAMMGHGRRLLEIMKYSDNDPTTTVMQKVKRFSTNAAGYVIFLILLFCSLSSIYAMANMDFTKDTLLYSQAKMD